MHIGIASQEVEYIILPSTDPCNEYSSFYAGAYRCWKESWNHALRFEMNQKAPLYSDDFTRQDEVPALFYRGECVGLSLQKVINLSECAREEDSYFAPWPLEIVNKLKALKMNIMTASYFTVAKKFRGRARQISWKELLLSLIVHRFKGSHADIMITAARKIKSNQIACYKSGAEALVKNLKYKDIDGETMDIVCWYKNALSFEDEYIQRISKEIWQRRKFIISNTKRRFKDELQLEELRNRNGRNSKRVSMG